MSERTASVRIAPAHRYATVQTSKEARLHRRREYAMLAVPINDPKHWRDRAEEARTVADQLTDADSKRRMLRIAEDYETLAKRAEQRLAAKIRNSRGTLG